MGKWEFVKGAHDLGGGVFAYLCPDGSWGLNNAGLVVDGDEAMLIDTLFDLASTREMLKTMATVVPSAATIDTLLITHGNGDHFFGNELVKGAEIIATRACAEEMAATPPQMLAELAKAAPNMGDLGAFFQKCFGAFDFNGINAVPPTKTFEKRLDLTVGRKDVQFIEVGPAHTQGDAIVYLPREKIVFTGDILFIGGTPIMWAGPIDNWIKACDLLLMMDVEVIVPGHGPITDKSGVKSIKGYLEYIKAEARRRYDRGMSIKEAVADIDLGPYAEWGESERTAVNVDRLYAEFKGDQSPPNILELFTAMAELWLKR